MKDNEEVPQMTHFYAHFCGYCVSCHCVKDVGIRSFYGPYFPAFGRNKEKSYLFVFSRIVSKIRIRKTPNTNTFHVVCVSTYASVHYSIPIYIVTTLKVIQKKNGNCYLVCEVLLIDRVFGNIFRQHFEQIRRGS